MPEVGTVKWFNNDKWYGFIKRDTGEDVFVHHSAIQAQGYRTLNEGERGEFDVKQGPKGLQAENVQRADEGRCAKTALLFARHEALHDECPERAAHGERGKGLPLPFEREQHRRES